MNAIEARQETLKEVIEYCKRELKDFGQYYGDEVMLERFGEYRAIEDIKLHCQFLMDKIPDHATT